ncbi:MAG: DMT family transporter [Planctomycetota bacterium]|jgi:drug/metabolite transporter (DMT)-like permease
MTKQKEAYLYALVTVLLWSTAASAFKISLRYLDVLPLLFYSAIVSTVVLFCCLLFQKRVNLLRTLTRRDYFHSALLGFLNPFLYYVVLFKAYSLLPAQQAQPLNFVWPITLVLLSIPLLKQKIKPVSVLAVIISFFGVLVISTRGDIFGFRFTSPTGVMLAVGSSVIWAVFWIYNVKDKRDEAVKLFLNFAFGSVFIFLSMLICARAEIPNFKGALGAVYIGLFEMGITFLVWLRALKLSRTTAHVAKLIYLVPFLSLVVIYFVVGEKILASTIVGVVFIVGGIVLQNFSTR